MNSNTYQSGLTQAAYGSPTSAFIFFGDDGFQYSSFSNAPDEVKASAAGRTPELGNRPFGNIWTPAANEPQVNVTEDPEQDFPSDQVVFQGYTPIAAFGNQLLQYPVYFGISGPPAGLFGIDLWHPRESRAPAYRRPWSAPWE